MEYSFQITEKDYIGTLAAQLKQKRKGILNILAFLLLTVGQSAYAVWYILSAKPEKKSAVFICLLSALVFALQIFYQFSIRLRAEQTLKRYKKNGSISESFWKTQRMKLDDDVLSLRCGKDRLVYDCAFFSNAETLGGVLVLTFQKGKEIQQLMLPESVFESEDARKRFIDALAASRQNSIRASTGDTAIPNAENAEMAVLYTMTKEEFSKALVRCTRRFYTTKAGMSLKNIARLACVVFLLGNIAAGVINTKDFIIYASLISLVLLLPFIVAFSPIEGSIARQNAEKTFAGLDEMNFSLAVFPDSIAWKCESFSNEISVENLIAVVRDKRYAFFYFRDNSSAFIPLDEENTAPVTKCSLYLEVIADRNLKSKKRVK